MKLTFTDPDEFESFARTFLAGVAVRDKTSPTVIGELAVDLKPGVSFDRLKREVLACAMADTGLSEEELTQALNTGAGDAGDEAPTDDGIVHEHIDLPPADEPEQEPEKPKRKRRTKAEIEAAALAEQRTFDPAQEPDAGEFPSSDGIVTNSDVSDTGEMVVTDAHAIEVIEAGPTGIGYNTPEADKPVGASAESLEKHAAAQAEYTPELIETLKGQAELFDANRTAHLNEGREAIAKHGFIKYMATFKGLGLDSAIATYNDDQVKLHRAAIAHLMAA